MIGLLQLEDTKDGLRITPSLNGLPPGQHGFHVCLVPKVAATGRFFSGIRREQFGLHVVRDAVGTGSAAPPYAEMHSVPPATGLGEQQSESVRSWSAVLFRGGYRGPRAAKPGNHAALRYPAVTLIVVFHWMVRRVVSEVTVHYL